ncbi:integron integrase [Reinekea blandensis]|uniref:Integron integrase Phage integrase Phage integrase N-terminal SAM-like domain n=1 Tax=Reinekea blandensis MED297 TaxID=314283 RepID=A4BJZ1_9GAMM|nr:integron integrase [Reinekea blandensis]EAR07592.1 Integron integrase; Phage integrase; Phage integrase N-terminal SAM-like domain [Reinekea sp. MED297] [Reinekea blandensis MED297]
MEKADRKPKLLPQMRDILARNHYSPNTIQTYLHWAKEYIYFHNKRHPKDLGVEELAQFLTHLATQKRVSPSTQAQALNALVYLYRHVLEIDLGDIDFLRSQRRFKNIPTVLSQAEVTDLLNRIRGKLRVMDSLLYGSGLRVNECVTLRMKDVDLAMKSITIRNGKGLKARVVPIPERLVGPLQSVMVHRKEQHIQDTLQGAGYVQLPWAFDRKSPNAAQSIQWQFLFSSGVLNVDKKSGRKMRWHCSTSTLQKAVKKAAEQAQLTKRVTCHTLRHSFATHLLTTGTDIRTIQQLMGHKDLNTTMIYTHILMTDMRSVQSPLDRLI